MAKSNYADKRDANEPAVVAEFVRHGCRVIRQGREAGFDLLVLWPSGALWLVEVKNPAYSWNYTDSERDLIEWTYKNNHYYVTIQDVREIDTILAELT